MKYIAIILGLLLVTVPCFGQQAQVTEQGQGQTQGISGDFGIRESFNSEYERTRVYVPTVDPYRAPLAAHFGGPNYKEMGPNYTSITTILGISKMWNVDDTGIPSTRDWGDRAWDGVIASCEAFHKIPRDNARELYPVILADIKKPTEGFGIGMCTVRATDDEKTSLMIFKESIRLAHAMGGMAIHVIAEGSTKELESWGTGIGVSYVRGNVSDSGKEGGTGSGGTGINFAESHYESLPWLQFVVYHTPVVQVPDKVSGSLKARPEPVADATDPRITAIMAYAIHQRR